MITPNVVLLLVLSLAPLLNATLYGWGKNDQGQLGVGSMSTIYTPTSIPFYSAITIIDVKTATNFHLAEAANGSVYASGLQYYGQFATGYTNTTAFTSPVLCPALNTSLDIVVAGTTCNANMNTNLLGWGNVAGYVQAKTTGSYPRIQVALPTYKFDGKVTAVNSVMEGVFVRLANNTVWAAGNNGVGRLGIGTTTTTYTFAEVTFWRTVPLKQIFSSQSAHICALAVNGSLYCWGQNTYGQLGVGDVSAHYVPTRVSYFDDNKYVIYKVAYGDTHTAVLTCGGRVFAFGANMYGQLGQTIVDSGVHHTPIQVTDNRWNNDIVDIATGFYQTFVRTASSDWYVWGGGAAGSLGLGTNADATLPTINTNLKDAGVNRIGSSSQSFNFFGWHDETISNARLGCPVLVNECATGNNTCSVNGLCTDLESGYSCSCKPGWVGDGYKNGTDCYDAMSCIDWGWTCVPLSFCDDSSGPRKCVCPDGYAGDGLTNGTGCVDIDECQGDPCASNAICTNTQPQYHCSCLDGFYGDPYQDGCIISCAPGMYAFNHSSCALCAPGYWSDNDQAQNCSPCPIGSYSSAYGTNSKSSCLNCPVGGYSSLGATYCQLCKHGYTNDVTDLARETNSTCVSCPLGQYGYYGVCYDCPIGEYSITPVAQQCHECPPGYNSSTPGALGCDKCPAGYYSRGGASVCLICPAGTYSSAGSTDCTKCGAGTSTYGLSGQSACSNCTAGTFASKAGSPTCYDCPAGFFSDAPVTTSCKRCPQGSFTNTAGQSTCFSCPGGTYTTGTAATSCSACAAGLASDGITCYPCTAGTYMDASAGSCQPCPAGTFVAVSGATSCFACSPGSYATDSGSTYCLKCGLNTYSNATTGFTSCAQCPPGWYSPGGAYVCSL